MSAADSSWLMPQELKFCLIFGIPSWLMPLRDRSGQRWPPTGKPYVVAATEVCSRFIGTCRKLRRTHSTYMFNEACLGSLMRFGFIGFRPLHLFPFSFFPLRTLLFLFLFMSSLASCPFISLLSFFCAYNGPGFSVYAHIYVQLRFQVAQVSTMGVHRLSLCIWFLFHRNHTHCCPVVFLFMSSSFCPCCAHICTLVLALILPPLGEACVCNPWNHRDPFGLFRFVFQVCLSVLLHSRGAGCSCKYQPNEEACIEH